jgi:hypothetical protein
MAKLTTKARKNLRVADLVENEGHARNAPPRATEYGEDEEKAAVRVKVKKKFPTIGQLSGQ